MALARGLFYWEMSMKNIILLLSILMIIHYAYGECVHEETLLGSSLLDITDLDHQYMVEQNDGIYLPLGKVSINPLKVYHVQKIAKNHNRKLKGDFDQYNRDYLKYYRYHHVQKLMAAITPDFNQFGYETVIVGKSLEGRDLYSVRPKNLVPGKKTILMFGRHHGDEGTANWIIEGFLKQIINMNEKFHDEFQLILYPMVNPDGAEAGTRYNKNNRDLNRSWAYNLDQSYDEAKIIHSDLKNYLSGKKDIVIMLDMHGSFTDDFIYRVKRNYINPAFYEFQQNFIDELGALDSFQKGNFILSNGHPKMARIVMIKSYGLNALTHETPKNIKIQNSQNRSLLSLEDQGSAVLQAILRQY
ncbi:MAG: hypothetical protein CME62_10080 [Halobacteriovoraceae bacterium]|nr:hypothetical protein [Halobacteriovoraceae bacterium]|tara:strand:+ start:6429 stop:7502 length:1074 start_codon:yes stop_codon:yes gene_type:complete